MKIRRGVNKEIVLNPVISISRKIEGGQNAPFDLIVG